MDEHVALKSYTKTEMAELYKVSLPTFVLWLRPWLKELRKLGYTDLQRILTIKQVEFIFDKLGRP